MTATTETKDARDWTLAELRDATPKERLIWVRARGEQLGREARAEGANYYERLLKLSCEFESTFDSIAYTKRAYRKLVIDFRHFFGVGYGC